MEVLLIVALFVFLFIVPLWKICKRAGMKPALSVIAVIPFVGVAIVSAILALKEWPLDDVSKMKKGSQ
jgi:uncharacterized membrane protein YoaK (UPF0700 family)